VELAHADGRIASLIGVEGGHSMNNSMGALRMLYALGARYMTLTHVKNTDWADSATDEAVFGGLSAFGREVVRECNRLGLMADLSHVSPATMHATLDVSTAPAFFSHSSARALCDHPRNVPDDVLARVRDTDGVVMVTFVPGFLNETCRDWMEELIVAEAAITAEVAEDTPEWKARRAKWAAANPRPACSIDDVADHIEHVREVAGVGAVGIGSDFDGIIETPDGVTDVSTYPRLLETLADRGWSDSELSGLTWGNALRVLRGTEAAARAATWEPSVATLHGL
jgi:membrane dipeptidase